MKKTKKPFFAKFLENQIKKDKLKETKGGRPDVTSKYPSDNDEFDVTLKYPSDGDEGLAD